MDSVTRGMAHVGALAAIAVAGLVAASTAGASDTGKQLRAALDEVMSAPEPPPGVAVLIQRGDEIQYLRRGEANMVHAAVVERQAGVADDVADGAGDEGLAGGGAVGDARGEIERRAGGIPSSIVHSPVWRPTRTWTAKRLPASASADAQRIARAGPSKAATNWPAVDRQRAAAEPLALARGVLEEGLAAATPSTRACRIVASTRSSGGRGRHRARRSRSARSRRGSRPDRRQTAGDPRPAARRSARRESGWPRSGLPRP